MRFLWLTQVTMPVTLHVGNLVVQTEIPPGVGVETENLAYRSGPVRLVNLPGWPGEVTVAEAVFAASTVVTDACTYLHAPQWVYPHWRLTHQLGAKLDGRKPRLLPRHAEIDVLSVVKVNDGLLLFIVRYQSALMTIQLEVLDLLTHAVPAPH